MAEFITVYPFYVWASQMKSSLQILNINSTYVYITYVSHSYKTSHNLTFPEDDILKPFSLSEPSILLFSLFSNNLLRLQCGQKTASLLMNLVAHLFNKNSYLILCRLYICRTAPLTSRRCILNIYSTNIRTEYFKHAA
jgi:hypothetical protein